MNTTYAIARYCPRSLSPVAWRLRSRCHRLAVAARYALGRSTIDDAWQMFHDAEHITGFRTLEGISTDGVTQQAFERYGESPQIAALAEKACRRVADKWSGNSDITNAAEDWAFDLIEEYARTDGLALRDSWTCDPEKDDAP